MVRNCPNPKYNPVFGSSGHLGVRVAGARARLGGAHKEGFVEPGLFLPAQQARQAAEAGEGAGGDGGPRGPVLEDGLAALTGLLSFFPNSRPLAAEVCRALVRARVAWASRAAPGGSGPLLGILGALSAGEAIVRLANRFPENVAVVNEAALAMGVLGGFGPVVDLMRGRPACLVAQEAGCCALVEMCRLGSAAMDAVRHEDDVAPARVVLEQARARFQSVGAAGGMLSRAELALGMLSALVAPPGGPA
ncbi:unnamed protein product [Prorocentrum cordatum]|uniref:Uncharacterized protein n=1 Tax=Prorocentrum cordatum TaxID=2364126 RepID=A0ABN9YLA3_9DINO|nr:unnamed protein product [Polarella glacialis]